MIDFIDIGCGEGGSIEWAKAKFGGETHLGIDNRPRCVQKANELGYNVMFADIASYESELPASKYVTMIHLLEHLENEEAVEKVIKKAINSATQFVLIRVPSFDSMEYLEQLGFRLTWTNWAGHSVHVTSDMLKKITDRLGLQSEMGHLMPILNSESNEIIPLSAPIDTVSYDPSTMEHKKFVEFKDVYRETYCIINLGCPFIDEVIELIKKR